MKRVAEGPNVAGGVNGTGGKKKLLGSISSFDFSLFLLFYLVIHSTRDLISFFLTNLFIVTSYN